jgi:hypothetical protein
VRLYVEYVEYVEEVEGRFGTTHDIDNQKSIGSKQYPYEKGERKKLGQRKRNKAEVYPSNNCCQEGVSSKIPLVLLYRRRMRK